jgi:drug/metabolite transporter (DMT)-like permease
MPYTLLPLLAVLIWSGNTVVSKMAAGAIAPAEINFYRWLLAALLLTPLALRGTLRNWPAIRPHLGKIVVLGLSGMVVYQGLGYYAAYLTTATHMGIIASLAPVMALALAVPLLGQRMSLGVLVGAALSIVGVLVVVSSGSLAQLLASGIGMGDGLMLLAMLAYTLYAVLLKKWRIHGVPALQLLYLQVLVAVIGLFPVYLFSAKTGLSAANVPLVLYAGVLASVLAPFLWMHAVANIGPSRATMFFNLLPLFTAVIAAVFLDETLALYHLAGGVLTVGGVLVAELWKPRRKAVATCAA